MVAVNYFINKPKFKAQGSITETKIKKMDRLIELTKRHKIQMDKKNILISVYTNASGFLWQMMKVDSGTDLGWSGFNGDCEMSGAFTSYENALEHALNLVDKGDLTKFEKEYPKDKFHWGKYVNWLINSFG